MTIVLPEILDIYAGTSWLHTSEYGSVYMTSSYHSLLNQFSWSVQIDGDDFRYGLYADDPNKVRHDIIMALRKIGIDI